MRWPAPLLAVTLPFAFFACSSGAANDAGTDAGPDGGDAGPPIVDGGPIGSTCVSRDGCAGNGNPDYLAVICAADTCASAGGPAVDELATVTLAGTLTTRTPDYLEVYVLAPALVAGGTLACPAVLAAVDGGTFSAASTVVNALESPFDTVVPTAQTTFSFHVQPVASGVGRVLVVQAYLTPTSSTPTGQLLATACATYDNPGPDAGSVALTVGAP